MTDWQHWAVALIVLLCLWSIVKSIRSFSAVRGKGKILVADALAGVRAVVLRRP